MIPSSIATGFRMLAMRQTDAFISAGNTGAMLVGSMFSLKTIEGVLRPTRGMTMAQVEAKFGEAAEKRAAIGEPPISRWRYADFDVFFEHNLVIHSVVLRKE